MNSRYTLTVGDANRHSGVTRFGPYEVDLRSGELRIHGRKAALREQAFEVLALLLEHAGEVVRREDFRARLWPADVFVDFDNNLNSAVTRLREVLGDSAEQPKFIETVPRRGYRFIAPVCRDKPDRKTRLAVLPLDNLSGDMDQEYFSDGLTEELISQLAVLAPDQLGIIGRTSSMQYKGSRKDIALISRELNLDYVVEGSVRRAEGRVRISVQLIDSSDQTHRLSKNYERDLHDILKLQREVAEDVARQIEIALAPPDSRRTGRPRSIDAPVHDAYIRGLFHLNRLDQGGFFAARECLESAVNQDPQFAPAHAKLAMAHALAGYFGCAAPADEFPKAETAARRALELDETLPDAYIAMALVEWMHRWDVPACRRNLERAFKLSPNEPAAHWVLSTVLSVMALDQDAALAAAAAAEEFDPLSIAVRSTTGWILYWSRRFEQAIAHARRTIEMDERCFHAWCVVGVASMALRYFDQAIASLEKARAIGSDDLSLSFLAMASGLGGRRERAEAALRTLEESAAARHVSPMCLVFALMGLGETDQVLNLLEKMYAQHDSQILMLKVSPIYDPVRPDARFQRLVGTTGLWLGS